MNSNNAAIVEGQSITLICNSSSNPPSKITWLKDGKLINKQPENNYYFKSYTFSNISIQNVNVSDEGNYQCNISNVIGSTLSANATITIYSKLIFFSLPNNM